MSPSSQVSIARVMLTEIDLHINNLPNEFPALRGGPIHDRLIACPSYIRIKSMAGDVDVVPLPVKITMPSL